MANPIKTSDLYQNTGELQELLQELQAVRQELERLRGEEVKNAAKLQTSVKKLNTAYSSQRDEIAETSKQADEIAKRYAKINDSLDDNAVKIAGLKNAQRQLNQINKLEAKLISEKEGSYNRLSAQYSLNKIRLNALSKEERANTEEGRNLVRVTNDIYQEMKRLQEETGKHTLSVGDYSKAIRGASKDQERLVKELKETTEQYKQAQKAGKLTVEVTEAYEKRIAELTQEVDNLGAVTGKTSKDFKDSFVDGLESADGALGDIVSGAKAVGRSFKALLANPLILTFTILAGAAITLFRAFQRSEKGAILFDKAAAVVDATMSQLVGVATAVAEGLEKLFNDPIGAIQDFGKAIVDNIINRLKGVIDFAIAAGKVIGNTLTFEFEKAEEAAKDAGRAFAQAVSGLDEGQQQAIANRLKETTAEIERQTNAFIALRDARRATRTQNRLLSRSIEQLSTSEEVFQAIADDTTKSFAEREAAAEKARAATERRAAVEIQLARNNLSLLNREIDLRRANGENVEDLLDRQLDAYREVATAERALQVARINNERTASELQQDRLERDLDILIDGFDNQKTVNERRLQDERLSLQQRRAIFDETARLADDSFKKQIETIQQFTGAQVDANALINESDAVALNQRIRSLGLSEIIEGRLLEIVRERRLAIQDLADAENELAQKTRDAAQASLQQTQEIAASDFELTQRSEVEKAEFVLQQRRDMLDNLRELNDSFADQLPPIDTSKLEASIRKLEADLTQARREEASNAFDVQQELAESEFNLLRTTEQEKTRFRLQQQRDRLQKTLELEQEFGRQLSDEQLQIIRNQIEAIDAEIEAARGREVNDIFDVFGFKIDDETKQAISETFGFAKQLLNELTQARVEAANQSVQTTNAQVAASQRALQAEISARNAGYAHRVQTATKELDQARKNNRKALKEQERAQKEQQRIQTIEQSVNLVTASAKIWKSFAGLGPAGPFLAAAAIGLMWGSFIAAKTRAAQLSKKRFRKGTYQVLGGGSHDYGNDTPLGFNVGGKAAYAERGEGVAVFPAKQTRKYRSVLPKVVRSLIRGDFEKQYKAVNNVEQYDPNNYRVIATYNTPNRDAGLAGDVSAIRQQGERRFFVDGKGRTVERYKNLTRVYE